MFDRNRKMRPGLAGLEFLGLFFVCLLICLFVCFSLFFSTQMYQLLIYHEIGRKGGKESLWVPILVLRISTICARNGSNRQFKFCQLFVTLTNV